MRDLKSPSRTVLPPDQLKRLNTTSISRI